jgi:hypothetical protein
MAAMATVEKTAAFYAKIGLSAFFILTQFYLLAWRKYDTFFLDVYPNDTPGPRISGALTVGQTFLARENGLARIAVMAGTYGQTIREDLVFRLWEEAPGGTLVAEKTIPGPSLEDNLYVSVRFDRIRNSRGKVFAFTLSSPGAETDNSISLWMNGRDIYREGEAFVNGRPVRGEFIFRAYAKRPVIAELGRIAGKYQGFPGSAAVLATAVVLFEAVQLYFLWALLGFGLGRAGTPADALPPQNARRGNG